MDIKDIFYILDIVNFMFEVDVVLPVTERILNLLKAFFMNYYYFYIPLIALIGLSIVMKSKTRKDVKRVNEKFDK
ncbi:hypothetical protein NMY3_00579 [Candidatus Nitrosocosmicus oleophilus]|uniref:Uncharacterized protein n=1 Tax=Candidatus Nitrosocosmicus oleophilus TaxID=1353260 RepID=A0A654LWR8_9ARCH|nr:hypothetical protein NMY3_00579 [Candidatus Nitrosocosmicus oleophilus]